MNMRAVERRRSPSFLGVLALLGLAGGLASCSDIEPVAPHEEPITDPTQLYMRLTLDHPAVNLSTEEGYKALQLRAIPREALGNPMTGLPAPMFKSRDTTKVRVTADGLLTAEATATGVEVIATLTAGPITHADTARVQVTDLATPKLAS